MHKNEFVPHDVALAMKELGFNEYCMSRYSNNGSLLLGVPQHLKLNSNVNKIEGMYLGESGCTAPLYQQAFRWIRERHNIIVTIDRMLPSLRHFFEYRRDDNKLITDADNFFDTYEEAQDACLRKIIEILKDEK